MFHIYLLQGGVNVSSGSGGTGGVSSGGGGGLNNGGNGGTEEQFMA
jgi:hypothetical protein